MKIRKLHKLEWDDKLLLQQMLDTEIGNRKMVDAYNHHLDVGTKFNKCKYLEKVRANSNEFDGPFE